MAKVKWQKRARHSPTHSILISVPSAPGADGTIPFYDTSISLYAHCHPEPKRRICKRKHYVIRCFTAFSMTSGQTERFFDRRTKEQKKASYV